MFDFQEVILDEFDEVGWFVQDIGKVVEGYCINIVFIDGIFCINGFIIF